MKRYKINMTSMQWGMIAIDLGKIDNPSPSTEALKTLAMLTLEHTADPEMELPYNVESVEEA